jgi:hypothetical protein
MVRQGGRGVLGPDVVGRLPVRRGGRVRVGFGRVGSGAVCQGEAVVVRSDVARSGVAGRSWFVSVWSGRVRSGG